MARDGVVDLHPTDIELDGATPPEAALAAASDARRIAIRFSGFKDGRGFSLAALLRQSGYQGRLDAVGPLLPDQETDLRRAGFDRVLSDRAEPAPRAGHNGAPYIYQPDPGAPSGRAPAWRRRALEARRLTAEALAAQLDGAEPDAILAAAVDQYGGRIAMLSSFGAEAALGLALLAEVAPDTPVLFLDTKRHFPQTLRYRDQLIDRLGLRNVQLLEPDADEAAREDADGLLYERDGPACCDLRKVRPLARALDPFDALITGRKRYHGGQRGQLPAAEFDGERVKINPLAFLSPEAVADRFRALDLPRHPLTEDGYASIGCWPCTAPADAPGSRAGRWAGQDRDECGIFDPAREARARRAGAVRLI